MTEWTPSELMPDSSFAPRAAAATTTTKTDAIAPKSKRITGIDMARGIAMAGMTVVHFVAWWEGQGALFTAAELFRGRAMPLFMLLGGIGVTLMAPRTTTPTRNLLIRAVMLLALGLFLTEHVDRLAIVLQAYALFFVLAVVLWRLPSAVLLGLAPLMVAVGAVTYQVIGEPRVLTPYDELFNSTEGLQSLVFDGFYPLFPVGAFFVFGMWLGRIDLRSERVGAMLLGIGAVVGAATWIGIPALVSELNLQIDFGGRAGDGTFHLSRLLDVEGHSAMPAWVVSALGTSAAVLGFSLLVAPRVAKIVQPLTVVGSMSLSYYVFQAWMTNIVPDTIETSVEREWLFTIGVYVVFVLFALVWRQFASVGPLEWVLRLGSGPKKSAIAV